MAHEGIPADQGRDLPLSVVSIDGVPAINAKDALDYIHAVMLSNMARAAGFALLGNRIQKVLPALDLPPPDVVVHFQAERLKHEAARFENWCIQYSLVSMISACERYLRDVSVLVCLVMEQSGSGGRIQRAAVTRICNEAEKDTSGLWKLLTNLFAALGRPETVIEGRGRFTSLDKIRNCIIHRRGVVGDLDVGKNGMLEAAWRKTTMTDPDGQIVTSLPFKAEKGGEFSVTVTEQKRSWKKGEQIALSVQDCQDMAFTLAEFCSQVQDQVANRLRDLLTKGA